jgi:hypothetical protein
MARGWESKSVEEQQSSEELTASGAAVDAAKRNVLQRAKIERQRQELDLQRERILSERTSSPVRRAALEAALADRIPPGSSLLAWGTRPMLTSLEILLRRVTGTLRWNHAPLGSGLRLIHR